MKQSSLFSKPEQGKAKNLLAKLCFLLLLNKRHSVWGKLSLTMFEQQKLVNFVASKKNIVKYHSKKAMIFVCTLHLIAH